MSRYLSLDSTVFLAKHVELNEYGDIFCHGAERSDQPRQIREEVL